MTSLAGKTVLLTRAAEDNVVWAERLEQAGARTVGLACIRAEAIADRATAEALKQALARADWLAFTSRRGVEAFAELHRAPLPDGVRVAVVGAATAAAAAAAVGRADLSGEAGTAASLAHALAEHVAPGSHVLIAVADSAADTLEETLAATGAACVRVNVYRTVPAPPAAPKRALSALGVDTIVLASPSAVAGLVNQVEIDIAASIYTIGPSTTAAAEAAGLSVKAQAEYPSLEGLMEAMT